MGFNRRLSPHALALGCIVLVYLVLSCVYLDRPGLQYDEALFVNAAFGDVDGSFVVYRANVLGWDVPLMCMPYIGAVKAALYAPLFAFLPADIPELRLPAIAIGAIVVVLTYAVASALFGRAVGLLAAGLTAIDPTVIFQIKADWGPAAIMMLCKMGSLAAFLAYSRTRRAAWFLVGAFVLGVGTYDKGNFVWFVVALLAATVLVYRRAVAIRLSLLFFGVVAFIAGCWPLLLYNVATGGGSLHSQFEAKSSLLGALHNKKALFEHTIDGGGAFDVFSAHAPLPSLFGGPFDVSRSFEFEFVLVALAASVFYVLRRAPRSREAAFVLVIVVVMVAEILVTPNATGPHHVIFIYPFQQMLIAYVAVTLLASARERMRGRAGAVLRGSVVAAVAVLCATELVVDAKYLVFFDRVGGRGVWSDAIYELVAKLEVAPRDRYALMDWGFNEQLLALSDNSIRRGELFWSFADPKANEEDSTAAMTGVLGQYQAFVFHSARFTVVPRARDVFELAVRKARLREDVTTVFERDGEPVYEVIRLRR